MVKQKQLLPNIPFQADPYPQVAGLQWCVEDVQKQQIYIAKNQNHQIQFAPITKIMNFYTCLHICQKLNLDYEKLHFVVSKNSKVRDCVTANLPLRLIIQPLDLYYALMLQGGNDSAIVLAENFGIIYHLKLEVLKEEQFNEIIYNKESYIQYFNQNYDKIKGVSIFLNIMNELKQQLEMKNTQFTNVTGLNDKQNLTTVADTSKLTTIAMNNSLFKQVVNSQEYIFKSNLNGNPVNLIWKNSNQMIKNQNWEGVKTGWTPDSGQCIVTQYQHKQNNKIRQFNIVIANAGGDQRKYIECQLLLRLALKLKQEEKEQKNQNFILKSIIFTTGALFLKSLF